MSPPKEQEETPTTVGARRRWPKGGPTKTDLKHFREVLLGLRAQILRANENLAEEALKGSGQDFSVDHMADHGTDNFDQDFSLALLEGETELVRDVQDALDKVEGRGELPFGLCETCAEEFVEATNGPETPEEGPGSPWIARGRLDAVPYARLCVRHQEIEERGQE